MSSARPKSLLIVDDSRVSRMMIRTMIVARRPEWTVLEAAAGDEALQQLTQQVPDYVTMDINMPGTIGTDVAEQILREHPGVRLVLFSANVQGAHQSRAAAMGAGFVAKPVSERSIERALELLERPA